MRSVDGDDAGFDSAAINRARAVHSHRLRGHLHSARECLDDRRSSS